MRTLRDDRFSGDLPEIEVIDGARVRKMSPRRRHGEAQAIIASLMLAWAHGRGTVATEWRFRISGAEDRRDSYVPDVAYVSNERLEPLPPDEREEPPFSPDVAVEIFSPGDRETIVAKKIERYLAYGSTLVLDVHPLERTIRAHGRNGERSYEIGDTFEHDAMPGFRLALAAELFDRIDPPQV